MEGGNLSWLLLFCFTLDGVKVNSLFVFIAPFVTYALKTMARSRDIGYYWLNSSLPCMERTLTFLTLWGQWRGADIWGDFIWYQSSYNSNQSESYLRHLNFDPYPSRTRGGPWVTLVATHATMRMSLIFKCPIISIVSELSGFWGVSTIKWNSYPTLL